MAFVSGNNRKNIFDKGYLKSKPHSDHGVLLGQHGLFNARRASTAASSIGVVGYRFVLCCWTKQRAAGAPIAMIKSGGR